MPPFSYVSPHKSSLLSGVEAEVLVHALPKSYKYRSPELETRLKLKALKIPTVPLVIIVSSFGWAFNMGKATTIFSGMFLAIGGLLTPPLFLLSTHK